MMSWPVRALVASLRPDKRWVCLQCIVKPRRARLLRAENEKHFVRLRKWLKRVCSRLLTAWAPLDVLMCESGGTVQLEPKALRPCTSPSALIL